MRLDQRGQWGGLQVPDPVGAQRPYCEHKSEGLPLVYFDLEETTGDIHLKKTIVINVHRESLREWESWNSENKQERVYLANVIVFHQSYGSGDEK